MEHQRCANMPAQGNALGKLSNNGQALKGRNQGCAALSGLEDFLPSYPGRLLARPPSPTGPLRRLAGLACFRAFGPALPKTAKVPDKLWLFGFSVHLLSTKLL